MASPKRYPVNAESFLINAIGICWPKIKNNKVRLEMNILAELLQDEINKKLDRKPKMKNTTNNPESEDIRYFISVFQQRYSQETDVEYRKINKKEIGLIKVLISKLKNKSINIEDYLSWVFDVFFDDEYNREKFTPMIGFVCGTFLTTKFFISNQSKIRKIKSENEKSNRRQTVRDYAKELFRKTKDKDIQYQMQLEYDGTITLMELERFLKNYKVDKKEEGE